MTLDDQRSEILRRYALGVPTTRLAAQYKVTYDQMRYWLSKNVKKQ